MKLNIKAFALTSGLMFGFGLFFITWWMIWIGGASGESTIISKIYIGYKVTPLGSFIGFVWAFFDWLIGGAIFAWLYNIFAEKFAVKTE